MIPFYKAKAFWQGVSYVAAGALALLVFFNVLPPQFLIGSAVIYAGVEAILKWVFDIVPELRVRGLW